MQKKLTKWNDNLKGKEVKCVENMSGSGLVLGKSYYIRSLCGSINASRVQVYVNDKRGNQVGGWAYLDELVLHPVFKEDFQKDLEYHQAQIDDIKNKLQFLEDTQIDEFQEDLYKAFKIMKKLNLGDIEDAKEIVNILNS